MNGRDPNATYRIGLLVAIGVIALAAVGGAALRPESAVNIIGFCSVVVVALIGMLQNLKVAERVEAVASELGTSTSRQDGKLEGVSKTVKSTSQTVDLIHTLTNSAMLEQKWLVAVADKNLALSSKDPKDAEKAAESMQRYELHKQQQDEMLANAGKKTAGLVAATEKVAEVATTLRQAVDAVPEKTANKVVEKLDGKTP